MMTGMIVLGMMNFLGYLQSPVIRWMAATLDGIVEGNGAVFEAKFMLSWSFSQEAAAEKHMPYSSTTCGVTTRRPRHIRSVLILTSQACFLVTYLV
jgi:hypothetical protein